VIPPVEYVQSLRIVDSRNRFAARSASVLPNGFSISTVGRVSDDAEFVLEEERNRRRRPSNRGDAERSAPLASTEPRGVEVGLDLIPFLDDASMALINGTWLLCRSRVAEHASVGKETGELHFACLQDDGTGVQYWSAETTEGEPPRRGDQQTGLICRSRETIILNMASRSTSILLRSSRNQAMEILQSRHNTPSWS
jgi:hypothetical protein